MSHISKDKAIQNHIHFYLVLGDVFKKHREDDHFHTRWSVDDEMAEKVHDSLKKLYASLNDEDLIPETEMIKKFFDQEGRDGSKMAFYVKNSFQKSTGRMGQDDIAQHSDSRGEGLRVSRDETPRFAYAF